MIGNKTIILTGSTGFLGSHIAEQLIASGYVVIALKRESSNMARCEYFKDKVIWLNYETLEKDIEDLRIKKPEILIHAAWNGVKSSDRDDWNIQEKNIRLLTYLLILSKELSIKKIIALGSQAEYGKFNEAIDETHICHPYSAYGCIKNCSAKILQTFAEQNNIQWYWLRLFSVFGPREEDSWLIPSVINKLLSHKEINLTACQQEYDYLYVKDFSRSIQIIIEHIKDDSGIYNLSTGKAKKLLDILQFLEFSLSPDQRILNIGALPYRVNQVMKMVGISLKFQSAFKFKPEHSIEDGLIATIEYYKNKKTN